MANPNGALNLLRTDIRHEQDVVLARQRARQIAAALKFDSQEQTRIATALSEIARNAFQYAGGGVVEFRIDRAPTPVFVISVRDKGKGIPNLRDILNGKYISRSGMGLGIIGAKRLMDEFDIQTNSGEGTTVVFGKKIPRHFSVSEKRDMQDLLAKIDEKLPDNPYAELQQQNRELLRALDELRERQVELSHLNRELDETNRGVVALYAELNDKADFLQRASELKSHFLSNMSHEFRTPLNSITALSQILLDRLDGELTSEQEKQVRFIRSSAQDLMDLVNDLLDLAKVEAGKVVIRPTYFTVNSLFSALRGMLRPLLAQNSSVRLVFDDPEEDYRLHTDEAKVSQILRNFISNALKFTERGEVRVAVSKGHDNALLFEVQDTGIGIAEEDQERIFLEWSQVEGRLQKAAKGSGLGLPLSRKLAQLLGGNVYVKSKLGLGSTFVAVIPLTFTGDTEVVYVPDIKREVDTSKLPVLVVEDNREALFLYEKYLKGTRFQVIPATDIKEAADALEKFRPIAIVLDVLLQGEHSWELLRSLKSDAETRDIPVYVITVVDNRDKALGLGADGFHSKPVDRGWLLEHLEAIAAQQRNPVLLIDDDPTSRYLLRSVLATSGYRLLEADNGEEGLRLAREENPSLVILDLSMPGRSGFEVLQELKQQPETRKVPVVIHTSKILEQEDRVRLEDAVCIVPKSDMSSRELAIASFANAFQMAGLSSNLKPERLLANTGS
ncbi:MAG TPA: ATP-binding protein [Terriglobales bacterium]|nr:ATP-binding protein [Terriglobales bacterium]